MTQLLPKPATPPESNHQTAPVTPSQTVEMPPSPHHPWQWQWLLMGAGVIASLAIASWYYLSRPQPEGLRVSGRIEGYETDIGAKVPGRVNFVAVREGDRVAAGQVIAKLDDAELQAQLQSATARITAAQQQVQQADGQIDVISSQIEEAQLMLQQSEGDTTGKVSQAESTVASAEADLGRSQANLEQALADAQLAGTNRDRYAQLRSQGAVSQQTLDQFNTTWETAEAKVRATEAAVNASQKQVAAAQGTLEQAQATTFNPAIRVTKITTLQTQLKIAKAQKAAAQADVKNAEAVKKQVLAQLAYLNVVSPIAGVVTARTVEPGAIVGSGKTLLTVINPDTVYLRGYIPEGEIGQVRVGQSAKVWLDSRPQQPLMATVSAIDTQASFTPENIYFKNDRVEQVFGLKLRIEQPNGFAKPGMPADAQIMMNQTANPGDQHGNR